MKILILGASGAVGLPLYQKLSSMPGYSVHGTYNSNPVNEHDAAWHKYTMGETSIEHILQSVRPNIVISSLNGDFETQLAEHEKICEHIKNTGGRLIFISTANVFDGDVTGGHSEIKKPHPASRYGIFKYKCEKLIQEVLPADSLIIRIPKVVDTATVNAWLDQARTGSPAIYNNLRLSLNSAGSIANAIAHCIATNTNGVVHLTSHDSMTFASIIEMLCGNYSMQNGEPLSVFGGPSLDLSISEYCKMLSIDGGVLHGERNEIDLSLASVNTEIASLFDISCAEVLRL